MAVHVWSRDGIYLGQIGKAGYGKLDISHPENEELKKALDALLARPPMSDAGGFEVRFPNQPSRYLEFPDEDWLNVAAVRRYCLPDAANQRTSDCPERGIRRRLAPFAPVRTSRVPHDARHCLEAPGRPVRHVQRRCLTAAGCTHASRGQGSRAIGQAAREAPPPGRTVVDLCHRN
jgi:hypothetical protein